MSCHRCGGLMVPDRELGFPDTERCVNRGGRPPGATRPIKARTRLWPLIDHTAASADRATMLAALAACAHAVGRSPSKRDFDAYCEQVGHPWRAYSLTSNPRRPAWRFCPDILREAGIQPTLTQIRKSLGRAGVKYAERGEGGAS